MKIGTLLNLEINLPDKKEVENYHCKVIEKNEHYLMIDYPINKKTKKTAFFHKGTTISVSFVGTDQAVYQFCSVIAARVKMNVPELAIRYPDKHKIQRIQRREFVRIDAAADVAIHSSNNAFSPFVTVTTDISGGGLSVIVPNGNNLEVQQTIDVWIVLEMHTGKHQYVYTKGEVVFIKTSNSTITTASIKFASITKQAQQSIINYCFEKQREARKKELL